MARPLNLGQIKARVQNELKYSPTVREWRDDVREVIQSCYDELAHGQAVPWLFRTASLLAFPDITVTAHQWVSTHVIGVTDTELEGQMYSSLDSTNGGIAKLLLTHLVGAELDIVDSSKRNLGQCNWEEGPFFVEYVAPDPTGVSNLHLDPRFEMTGQSSAQGDLIIRFRRILLPPDCDQVLRIFDPDQRQLSPISPAQERVLGDPDRMALGDPRYFTEDGGFQARLPPVVYPGVSHQTTPVNASQHVGEQYQTDTLPVFTEIAAAAAAGGTLTADVEHTVFVSWWSGGTFGPPSNEVTVTPTGANLTIALSNLPVASAADIGRKVGIFVRRGEGPFYLAGFQLVPTTSTFSITAFPGVNEAQHPVRWDEVYAGPHRRCIRLLPRASEMKRLELQYQKRPRQLIADTDTPEFEAAYHEVLVYMAVARIANRDDPDLAKRMVTEYKRVRRAYDSFYLPQARYGHQKGMIGQPSTTPPVGWIDPDAIEFVP